MPSNAKLYRTYSAAAKARGNNLDLTIIQVGNDYLVGNYNPITEVSIIHPVGHITGHITLRHLERLGNGNWALTHEDQKPVVAIRNKVFYGKE